LPGDTDVIYASTHLGGEACPPKPDMSQGYVWALYDTYDIFRSKADGSGVVRLTETKGYDAEGTVCAKDGSILFTSVRDGDLELYRMDADGKNVKRLTNAVGYDGGAFFNEDCTKIVWRASRPKGKAEEDYKALLAKGLVRPTKLEIWVANADGSEAVQVTYLDAASFAPFFFPGSKRIIFSSNYGDPKGREFDLWAVNVDGSTLERITTSPGFDGFPIFSPDGKWLAFSSNRATPPGARDTNVFLARWNDAPPKIESQTAADRAATDVRFLADPAREGRGVGTKGLEKAGEYIEERFETLGLLPAGSDGYRQPFEVATSLSGTAALEVDGKAIDGATPLSFSAAGAPIAGQLVFVGYGIQDEQWDDYKGVDVKDKIVVARRFVPDDPQFESSDKKRRNGDLRRKAWLARERGAKAIVIVDLPAKPAKGGAGWKMPDEAKAPALAPEGAGDVGIPAVVAPRGAMSAIVDKLMRREKVQAKVGVTLKADKSAAFNVVGKVPARAQGANKLPGYVVIGAHYDHLGLGGHGSLAPDKKEVHHGADDNASGTAALLEAARLLADPKGELRRDVVLVAFSAEERGILGSTFFTKNVPASVGAGGAVAMINMDMVGRVRSNKVDVIGHDTAGEWGEILKPACSAARIDCAHATGGGYGPSDHTPFYAAGAPVLFFFSGTHGDYHKPSDVADKVNAAGVAQVARVAGDVARAVANRDAKLTYKSVPSPPPRGDTRSFGASLGTIPDYAGPPEGTAGVLLAGVRPGGAAEQAGMRRGDVLTKIGTSEIRSVEDLMFVLNEAKPGQKVKVVVVRDGKPVTLDVTFQASKGR
jgi:hypothetical protein